MASYKIEYSKAFIKDYKKLSNAHKDLTDEIIDRLAKGEILEAKYKDHALSGNLKGFRECHIKPDLLLVYEKLEQELILNALRVGKHSKIF